MNDTSIGRFCGNFDVPPKIKHLNNVTRFGAIILSCRNILFHNPNYDVKFVKRQGPRKLDLANLYPGQWLKNEEHSFSYTISMQVNFDLKPK